MPRKREVWHPPSFDKDGTGHPGTYTKADIRALQALAQGEAGEGDQKRALDWIIHHACLTYDNSFVADDPNGRIGAFVEGRRFAGQQIIKLLKLKPETLDGKEN